MNVANSQTQNTSKQNFKPSYTWPNETFPFRVYYDSPKCRIFIIENIQNNWKWMSEWHEHFRKTDFFFVYCGWYHSPGGARETDNIFSMLNLDKKQFFIMYNSPLEMQNFAKQGFYGDVINHNAWLDKKIMRPLNVDKIYNAIYVARRSAFKRHLLASKVSQLALIAGPNHGNPVSEVPPHIYLNDKQLSKEKVCEKINQAHCGLILSASEGACFSSSEYLLCGVPVVSTPSKGGRDIWYDEYNSIICEPTPDGVALAVEEFIRNPRDPQRIRQKHIEQTQEHRSKFIKALADVFRRCGVVDVDPVNYFQKNFFHKLRTSYKPDFQAIFGSTANAKMLTTANFQEGESINRLSFNQDECQKLRTLGKESSIPLDLVRTQAKNWFNKSVEKINNHTYSELCKVMIKNKCNKPTAHNYTQLYDLILSPYINKPINFIEIGLGTNNQDVPSHMSEFYVVGSSLRGWREYFNWKDKYINGGDIDPRILFQEPGIRTHYLDQTNPVSISACYQELGFLETGIDCLLDDALHQFHSNITLLLCSWQYLNRGGIYMIEDMSKKTFDSIINMIEKMALDADYAGFELPSTTKSDNRVIVLQKR
jgi:hypothetical protein